MIWWNSQANEGLKYSYLEGLMLGEPEALLRAFSGTPEIYDVWHGRVKGEDAARRFIERAGAWLRQNSKGIEVENVVDTGDYIAEESILRFDFLGKALDFPVVAIADRDTAGKLSEIRVYYRTVDIDPQRSIRQPLLQGSPDATPAEGTILHRYLTALEAGDVEAVEACFEPGGTFRGGPTEFWSGPELAEKFYPKLFELGGGATLEHCKLHDDGKTYVLEFNALIRGPLINHPQAGVAIYERGDSGLIAHARVSDDTQDPGPGDRWA
jgi:hypothetical protein